MAMKMALCSVNILKLGKVFLHFNGVWVGNDGQRPAHLAQSGDGKVTYEGGLRKCITVKEGMGLEEVVRMVKKITGTDMSERKLWYSLKYDREMLVAVEGGTNVKMILKGNDEHDCLYVAGNEESVAVFEGRVRDFHDGKLFGRTGRNGDDGVEVDDDEISIVSEDAGDEEIIEQDDTGDKQSAEKGCDKGKRRNSCTRLEDGQAQARDSKVKEWKNGVGERIE
ncbi:hypothetical protein Cgig2_032956 [Carnegiea gigantea]|uniref:Uncharacterized protein n=1 Tax=Carnegiea gigantea TaxID=171969 RepID=A0A9Q1JJ09_9CARY|nr:hypothetical protein Cgig2_032956 [Carnegiea gigantea]